MTTNSSTPYVAALKKFYNTMGIKYNAAPVNGTNHHVTAAQRLVSAHSAIKPGSHVLDLATGTGNVAFAAAEIVGPTGRVVGIDISDEFLGIAEKTAEEKGVQGFVYFIKGDVCFLGEPTERLRLGLEGDAARRFDMVTCGSAIGMFESPRLVLDMLARWVLRPGGVFVADALLSNVPATLFLDVAVPRGFRAPIAPLWLSDPEKAFRDLFGGLERWEVWSVETEKMGGGGAGMMGKWDVGTAEKVEQVWESITGGENAWVSFGFEEMQVDVKEEIRNAWVKRVKGARSEGGYLVSERMQCIVGAVIKD